MPWVTLSCEGGYVEETFSGYDLSQDQSEEGVEVKGATLLLVIPLAALIVLGVVLGCATTT